jgi:hypothetical protein
MPVTVKKKPIAAKVELVQSIAPPKLMLVVGQSLAQNISPEEFAEQVALAEENVVGWLETEIDALGEMQAEVAVAKAVIDAYQKRFGILRDRMVEEGAVLCAGTGYVANVKEKGNKVRTIKDMPLAVKHLGVETFLKVAKIGMADVDKYLTAGQQEEVIEVSESKTRSMTITKKG